MLTTKLEMLDKYMKTIIDKLMSERSGNKFRSCKIMHPHFLPHETGNFATAVLRPSKQTKRQ
jgi:hypothetical protein